MQPLVSVIIPHYDRTHLLAETISSVIQQTYSNWEILVVDDGSDEAELNILKSYNEPRIHLFLRSEEPKGPSKCRNIGISKAKGNFLLFLDSDDLLAPWNIEVRLQAFQEFPEYDFLLFPTIHFSQSPGDSDQLWFSPDTKGQALKIFLTYTSPWCVSSGLWKKDSILRLGGFDEGLIYGDDAEMHIRALLFKLKYKEFPHTLPDCFIRRSENSRITNQINDSLLRSREIFLDKVSLLLTKYHAIDLTRHWQNAYLKEAEFRLFKKMFNQIQPVLDKMFLLNLSIVSKYKINTYFMVAKKIIERNYLLFRAWRKFFCWLAPSFDLQNNPGKTVLNEGRYKELKLYIDKYKG